ncbi:hypothetical protein ABZV65_19485 [Streptomyces bauhiniae]|uniref:hypothetical protein n=1 Tax=Streptomyces bauhiniae TaxID=2340725 RepID=UPI0033A71525
MYNPTPDTDGYEWPNCVACHRPLWADETNRLACRPCQDKTGQRIAALPGLFQQLDTTAMLMRGARRPGGGSSGSKTPPIPPRLEVLALVGPGGVAARLAAVEDAWRQALGWPIVPPTAVRAVHPVWRGSGGSQRVGAPVGGEHVYPYWRTQGAAGAVTRHVAFLGNNLLWACSSYESVGQDVEEIRRLHAECLALVQGERRPGRVPIGACPTVLEDGRCGTALTASAASHRLHCGGCGSRWETLGEWRELRAAQERMLAELATRQEAEGVAA